MVVTLIRAFGGLHCCPDVLWNMDNLGEGLHDSDDGSDDEGVVEMPRGSLALGRAKKTSGN